MNRNVLNETLDETPDEAPYQQDSPCTYMFLIPIEVVVTIALYTDIESQLAFAYTCRLLNKHRKLLCKKPIYTCVSNTNYNDDDDCKHKRIKQTEHFMSQTGWRPVEAKLEIASISPENSYAHSVRALHLSNTVDIPKGINHNDLTALMLKFNSKEGHQLNFSLEKFPNLMLLSLTNVTFEKDDKVPKGFGLHLKAISLNNCKCTNNQILRILDDCTNLQEIELSNCGFGDGVPKFPPPLKKLELLCCSLEYGKIDISLCTELKHLIIDVLEANIISHPSARLDIVKFNCRLNNLHCLGKLLSDVKILAIDERYINDYGESVPSLTNDEDTHHLNISLFENLKELHVHNCSYIGHTLICKLPQRTGSIIIKLFPDWDEDPLAEFEFELSLQKSPEVSIDLSIKEGVKDS